MNENVIIEIAGLHSAGADNDSVEMIHAGKYYFRGGKHYLKYQESLEENQICDNMIKISPKEVEVIKKGAMNTTMVFTMGQKNVSVLETPFGTMTMGVDTTELKIKSAEDNMSVDIGYALDMNYEFLSDCHVSIKIRDAR